VTADNDRPNGVVLLLADGTRIPLVLERGPVVAGHQVWVAYGPDGMPFPDDAAIVVDDMPAGTAVAVAVGLDETSDDVVFVGRDPVLLPRVPAPPSAAPGWSAN
jgi:hypothetical protein